MRRFDLPPSAPAGYLAWDEAFLDSVEEGAGDVLWFWESATPFVVVGYGQQVAREADLDSCSRLGIPVLRRCTGGGAVLQGPGCLNYGLALRETGNGPLATISGTNETVLSRIATALSPLLGQPITREGHTDLTLPGPDGFRRKFSGNAQRRKRNAVLFHGTFLIHMDLDLVALALRSPSVEPEYRAGRSHGSFIANIGVDPESIRNAIAAEWGASADGSPLPDAGHRRALEERYLRTDWHQRR